ncbi:putative glycolipid-binding domain-containing protein [Actinoplanes sp. GCM10030250]|uniref:putative glycolipid-binding domain-containing protein n=1 Tax=Actinoplanes sp. GCM10030250 TaxID=3273376 RepID=UPI00360ADDAA
MTETMTGQTGARTADGTPQPVPPAWQSGSLAWQRTDLVGTELVLAPGSGNAVVHGTLPYAMEWTATLDGTEVRELTITCKGAGWTRNLGLGRSTDGWSCRSDESGDAGLPPPGPAGPAAIAPDAVPRITDSPIFVTWAIHHLGLTVASGPVTVPSVRVLVPSLAVVPGTTTYHLVSPNRLRVTGDGPPATYEVDPAGVVAYQAGRLRLAR